MRAVLYIIMAFFSLSYPAGGMCAEAKGIFSSPQEKDAYNVAARAYADKLYPTAQKGFEGFIKKYPRSAVRSKADYMLAEAYFHNGMLKKAEAALKRLYRDKAYKNAAGFWLGKVYLKAGKVKKAAHFFEEIRDAGPGSSYFPYAVFSLGSIYLKEDSTSKALDMYRKVYTNYPAHPAGIKSRLFAARCFFRMRRYDMAESAVRGLIRSTKGAGNKEMAAEAYFLLAQINERLGLYTRSIRYFHRVIKYSPEDEKLLAQAYYGLALGYWQMKYFRDGSIWFKRFLKKFPANDLTPAVMLRLAECYISLKNYKGAVFELKQFIENYPGDKNTEGVRYWLAEAYFREDRLEDAEREYERLMKDYPKSGYIQRAYYGMGWIYYKRKKYALCRKMFYRVVKAGGGEDVASEALLKIGDTYLNGGDYKKAIGIYTEVLEKYPGRWPDRVLYHIGSAYLEIEEYDKAIAAFDTLIYGYPDSRVIMTAYYKKGSSLFRKGLYKKARDCFMRVFNGTASNSLREKAGFRLGRIYYTMGDYEKAEAQFEKLVKLFPKGVHRTDTLYELGMSRYQRGEIKKAFESFRECIENGTGRLKPDIWFWIGENFFNKGQFDTAFKAFAGINSSFPKTELADDSLFLAARCLFKSGKYTEAKEKFYELAEDYPDSSLVPDAVFGAAESLIFLKDYKGAMREYRRIIKEFPGTYLLYDVYMRMGDVQKGLGRYKEAVDYYARASESRYAEIKIQAMYNTADIFYKQKKLDESQKWYLKIAYKYPGEKEWADKSTLKAAEVLAEAGRTEDAAKLYKKIASEEGVQGRAAKDALLKLEGG